PGYRVGRPRESGLLFQVGDPSLGVQYCNPIVLRIAHLVAEDGCANLSLGCLLHEARQAMSMEDVVAKNERHRVACDKVFSQNESLSDTVRRRLFGIRE